MGKLEGGKVGAWLKVVIEKVLWTVPEHQRKTWRKGTEEAGKPGPEVT